MPDQPTSSRYCCGQIGLPALAIVLSLLQPGWGTELWRLAHGQTADRGEAVWQPHKYRIQATRPDYAFDTTNHMHDRSMWFWTYGRDVFDIACIELSTAVTGWFPPVGESLSSYRLTSACQGPGHAIWVIDKMLIPSESAIDPGVTMEDASTADRWITANPGERWQRLNPSADRQRLYLAQALVEGVMVNPATLADHHAAAWGTKPILYHDITRRYFGFHSRYAERLRRSQTLAKTVVLVSVADMVLDRLPTKEAFYGLCQTLHKAHIPFDVRILERTDEVNWDRYQTVLLPSARCISDDALSSLNETVQAGKVVLRFDRIAERTEHHVPRTEELSGPLASIPQCEIDPSRSLGPYNEPAHAESFKSLVHRLRAVTSTPVKIEHPASEYLIAHPVATDEQVMLHLLNYHMPTDPTLPEHEQLTKELAIPATQVKVELALPKNVAVSSVSSRSPDHKPVDIEFTRQGDRLFFTVPRIDVWEMVLIDIR